jgi:hypothetical protein
MYKMGLHDPFGHFKHKLWPKEGLGVPIWLATTKSWESPRFPCVQVACRWCATYHWKALDKSYNFAWDLISIWGLDAKFMCLKIAEVRVVKISGVPLGSPRTKWHLGAGPVAMHIVYYKREGGGFPQIWAMLSLVNSSLPVACPSTKSAPTMH